MVMQNWTNFALLSIYEIFRDALCSEALIKRVYVCKLALVNRHTNHRFMRRTVLTVGQDSSVGIATLYGLYSPAIEYRWGDIFHTRSERPWGPPSLLYNWYQVFPEGKAVGVWRWTPTHSSAVVKERVVLYLCSPSGPSRPLLYWRLCPIWPCYILPHYLIKHTIFVYKLTEHKICVVILAKTFPGIFIVLRIFNQDTRNTLY
jgi:hypothetical protein